MPRETSPYIVGDYWLDKRRDGASPDVWQIAYYHERKRTVVYRSTRKREVDEAKPILHAFAALQQAKGRQDENALVAPHLVLYWRERGAAAVNNDQTSRSLRTFAAFLCQDEVGAGAVIADLRPALFDRFRKWRMAPHAFAIDWEGEHYEYSSAGVSGDTVDRMITDVRSAINHAEANGRIPFAPKIKRIEAEHRSPPKERILTEDELASIFWYARHHSPSLFRFVALQMATSVRPMAARVFDPSAQFNPRFNLIDLQPQETARTKKRNAIIPTIRPMRVILKRWIADGSKPCRDPRTAWRTMRTALGLGMDVEPKTIRYTIATWCYEADVPTRQIEEMLGHSSDDSLKAVSKRYAKYRPDKLAAIVAALSTIWLDTSRRANMFGAVHSLTIGKRGGATRVDYIGRKA